MGGHPMSCLKLKIRFRKTRWVRSIAAVVASFLRSVSTGTPFQVWYPGLQHTIKMSPI